jgi:hypothetical protein
MTRQERAIAALAALRADGWTLPTSTVPIDLLLDTKADALDVIAERDSLRAEVERLGGDFEVRRPDGVEIVGPVAMLGFIERVLTDAGAAPEDGDSLADAVASIAEERDSLRAKVERLTALRDEFRERARLADLELCGLRIDLRRGLVDTVRAALADDVRIRAEERVDFAEKVAAWLDLAENDDIADRVPYRDRADIARQILAAARGERTLP